MRSTQLLGLVDALLCASICACACASAGAPLPEGAGQPPPPPQDGASVSGDGFTRVDTSFVSGGLRCAAWLYLPEGVERPPVVVFAHGLSGQREMAFPRYAERLARAGMASLLFDYRYWGASEGEPRFWTDAWKQLADLEAAIAFARSLPQVDGARVALFGTSFGGGHVVMAAARDHWLSAVIAQVPGLDPRTEHEHPPAGALWDMVRAAFRDKWLGELFGGERTYIKVMGAEDEAAVLTGPDALEARETMLSEGNGWPNRVTAGLMLDAGEYAPIDEVHKVQSPLLVVVAEKDRYAAPSAAHRAAKLAPYGEVHSVDLGHFEVYDGEGFEMVIGAETEFLRKNFGLR